MIQVFQVECDKAVLTEASLCGALNQCFPDLMSFKIKEIKREANKIKRFPEDEHFYLNGIILTRKVNEVIDVVNLLIERSDRYEKNN